MLEARLKRPIPVATAPTRLGDQPVFYCNVDRAARELDWKPRVSPEQGVDRLLAWIQGNREEIARFLTRKGIRVAALTRPASRLLPTARARDPPRNPPARRASSDSRASNWDEGHHLHPDERFISMVEEKLAFPKSPAPTSTRNARRSTPTTAARAPSSTERSRWSWPRPWRRCSGRRATARRTWSAARSRASSTSLTVWLVYRITRRFTHRRAALFAAGLSAFCVLGIQLSHFWAVDAFLTAFTAAALLGAVRIAQDRSGLAGDALTGVGDRPRRGVQDHGPRALRAGRHRPARSGARARRGPAAGSARAVFAADSARPRSCSPPAAVTVRVFLPHVFLGPSPLSFRLDPRWLDDLRRLKILSSSVAGFPAGPPVGGPHAPLPGRELRPLGRGRRLRPRGDRRPRLVGRRHRPAPAVRRSLRSSLYVLFLFLVPRPDARQVDPLLLPGVSGAGRADRRRLLLAGWLARGCPARAPRAHLRSRGPRRHVPLGGGLHVDLPPPAHARRGDPVDLRARAAAGSLRATRAGTTACRCPCPTTTRPATPDLSLPLFDPDSPEKVGGRRRGPDAGRLGGRDLAAAST